jgi:hypothetical protein
MHAAQGGRPIAAAQRRALYRVREEAAARTYELPAWPAAHVPCARRPARFLFPPSLPARATLTVTCPPPLFPLLVPPQPPKEPRPSYLAVANGTAPKTLATNPKTVLGKAQPNRDNPTAQPPAATMMSLGTGNTRPGGNKVHG